MMMLKALSAIALSALPVQSAHDTWILHKKDTWFGSPEIPCRRADDIGDLPELENQVKGKKLIGWTIKLPTSTIDTDKSFTGAVNKHEPRFVCVGKNNEIFYYHEDGTEKGSGVQFTAEHMAKVVAKPLFKLKPERLIGMGYTVLDQYLAEYLIKKDGQDRRFYLFFACYADWRRFHGKLEAVTGFTNLAQDVIAPPVMAQIDNLLTLLNGGAVLDTNAKFLKNAMCGGKIIYLEPTSERYLLADGVNEGNIASLIEDRFTKPGLKRKLKKYLGLETKKRRRRMSTMQRLLDAERAFSS